MYVHNPLEPVVEFVDELWYKSSLPQDLAEYLIDPFSPLPVRPFNLVI
jgi:hypothetical protein